MPTIAERVQALHARLRVHVEHADAAQKATKFTERVEAVRELRERLDRALAIVEVLEAAAAQLTAAEIAPVRKPPSADKVTETLRAVSDKLKTAPLSLNEGRDFATFRKRFEDRTSSMEDAVSKSIGQIEQGSPTVDEAFLRQVETVASYDLLVRDIRTKRDEFRMATLRGASTSTIQIFLERRAALRAAVDSLAPDEFPPAVIEFFKAARRATGAPLQLLTDDVRAWLTQRDLLTKVRVSFAS
jgi:hypothetical protein